ncbi:MAG TPA: TMEM175 family protein [Ktedonobacteraceae bacterium]|nr:TMEM175 family protein [Ktedonobacteraceae bacterium]
METRDEPLPTDEPGSELQNTDAITMPVLHTDNKVPAIRPITPAPPAQRLTRFIDDIRPTPGSNVQRIYGISDCVIAVAFTLFVVNIHLPPDGLSESQLLNFIKQNLLSGELPFYLATYLVVASAWISHYRIFVHLKRSSSLFIVLNILFLASIVFLPVPVAFFYQFGNQAEVWRVFAITQMVTSTTLLLMWIVARLDHLLDQDTPTADLRYTTTRLLIIPVGTVVSIGVTFYDVWLAEGIFLFFYVLSWSFHILFYRHNRRVSYVEGTMRMCSITDNMTAVAITFLITTIASTLLSNSQQSFSTALNAVLEELPVYSFSLLIVGFYWLSHHRMFMVIRRHNMMLIWLNFVFLLFIELQPTINSLRATYPTSQTTAILYASGQALTGLMLLVIWWYAAKGHRLIDTSMNRIEILSFAFRALLVPMIFILSVAIILFRNDIAFYFWLLVILLEVADLIYRRVRRRHHNEVPIEAKT